MLLGIKLDNGDKNIDATKKVKHTSRVASNKVLCDKGHNQQNENAALNWELIPQYA